MKRSYRWFGPRDEVTPEMLRATPGEETGVISACHHIPTGEVWSRTEISKLQSRLAEAELPLIAIESVPLHIDIKLGRPTRDKYIDNYCATIRNLGDMGVRTVVYNCMAFDWLRTNLEDKLACGSKVTSYSQRDFAKIDLKVGLPGWQDSFTPDELQQTIDDYRALGENGLRDNLLYALRKIVPVAEAAEVRLAIHPDDPCHSPTGVPQISKNLDDLLAIVNAVNSRANGICLCYGALGTNPENDLIEITRKLAHRINYVHLRNIIRTVSDAGEISFKECHHPSRKGCIDIPRIVKTLLQCGYRGYWRPDHAPATRIDLGVASYPLNGRVAGAMYIQGLVEAYADCMDIELD